MSKTDIIGSHPSSSVQTQVCILILAPFLFMFPISKVQNLSLLTSSPSVVWCPVLPILFALLPLNPSCLFYSHYLHAGLGPLTSHLNCYNGLLIGLPACVVFLIYIITKTHL